MSEKTKSFGAGAIIMSLFMTLFAGAVAMVGLWASEVPKLQQSFKIEVSHLNQNLSKLTEVMEKNAETTIQINNKLHKTDMDLVQIKSWINLNQNTMVFDLDKN